MIATLVFTRIDLVKAWTQFQELSWLFVILTTLYYLGLQWLSCLRWQIVLKATKHFIPVNSLLNSYLAGMFLNLFLPGAVGGDVYQKFSIG
ncbi:lysylphosphatidylglycerol synthase domain-containing protein [Aerosakkonemataceae cyanobacterium BLCC-F50]|uniref:Lysylphosphatidylglycerol synthase domain-containing protein n=1 Tax=Floridaenema flaviceps BLCC-F50 TaxID=3153642 RepID=A0ABV4XSX0_9CYAN